MTSPDRRVAAHPFQYSVLRAVPRVDRGEFVNVGIIVYCQAADFLRAAVAVNASRLRALEPRLDGRLVADGAGSRENVVGTGADDVTDALDRRVEFKTFRC